MIGRWQPSARVQALDKEQIADIRQRLNVDVTVPEGEPETWPPIESFKDMVSGASKLLWHYSQSLNAGDVGLPEVPTA